MSPINIEPAALASSAFPLSSIRVDGGTQSRSGITNSIVSDYAEAMREGAVFPRITAFHDGSDYWLADGFHRFHAMMMNGLEEADIDVRQGTRRDAILFSVGANSSHGLRRTNDDKRRAVSTLLDDAEWSTWSDREIGRRCGVGADMVGHIRRTSPSVNDSERTYITKHGTVATMNTAGIGKSTPTVDTSIDAEHSPMAEVGDDEITAEDLAADPGFQKAVEALNNAKALYDEVQAMPPAEPVTPEQEAQWKRAFGTPEDRSNLMAVINATRLLERLPTPDEMARSVPPTMSHAVDAAAVLKLSDWFQQFASAWARREGASA